MIELESINSPTRNRGRRAYRRLSSITARFVVAQHLNRSAICYSQLSPLEEEERIATLLWPIHSLEDAIKLLGTPDYDGFVTHREYEKDDRPPSLQYHRQIRYEHLSTVADVWIEEHRNGKAWWQLQGKYVGNQNSK